MDLGLAGKRAVVMAASRGLGYATALTLAREGAQVLLCSRDLERARAAAARIAEDTGARCLAARVDVSDAADLEALFATVDEVFDGGLDVLVCNAGGPPPGDLEDLDDATWERAYHLTLMSVVRAVRLALPRFRAAGGGQIAIIASSSLKRPLPNLLLSNVFRPALHGLCASLAGTLAADQVRINCVAPGRIATERIDELDAARAARTGQDADTVRAESIAAIPAGRLGEPDEFARVVTFVCSPAAAYVSGTAVLVDGAALRCL